MKPIAVTLPPDCAQRIRPEIAAQIVGVGETRLLMEPLLGFIASRECPGHIFLETLARVPEWVKAGRVIVSGFHSPLEQQVLCSVLRRKGRVVKVLARGISEYRPTPEEREPLLFGQMLIITAYPSEVHRTTRQTSLHRNRLVLALTHQTVTPYVAPNSPLADLLKEKSTAMATPALFCPVA
jgi:predicted Rossmann fold nucleotide-binding protein DprA/Smf involved in DNA uptake